MFPLKERKLIRGFDAHIKAGLGGAADYRANYVTLYAPFDGRIETYKGVQGGNWLRLIRDNGDKIEFAHLSKYIRTGGSVKEGERIAITGNTGEVTDYAHKHIQIIRKNKRLDPEKYNWESLNKTFMKITIVANKITWNYKAVLPKIVEWFNFHSGNKIEVVFDTKETSFDLVPLAPFGDTNSVDVNWYREKITPLATGEATVLLLNPDQYQIGGIWGFMTYGDPGRPVRMEVACTDEPNFPEAHLLVHRVFHEICHALYFLTGQPDRTHELLLVENAGSNRTVLLNEINYPKLQEALSKIKPNSKIKIRQIGWTDKEKGLYIGFDLPETRDEIISKINSILPKYELDEANEYNLGVRPF